MRGKGYILLAVFLFALIVRLAWALPREIRFPDSEVYLTMAGNLLAGKGFVFGDRFALRAPGYPAVIAFFYRFAGGSVGLRVAQCLAGGGLCVVLYFLGKAAFGPTVGLVAAGLAAIYPFFVFFSAAILSETLFTLLLALVILGMWQLRLGGTTGWCVVAGVANGMAVLLRPSQLLFAIVALPAWVGTSKSRRREGRGWLVFLGVTALVISPWVLRNYFHFGRFVPTTLEVGASLYEANSPDATGGPAMDRVSWPQEIHTMGEYDRDRHLRNKAFSWIASNPGQFLGLARVKLARFWSPLPNAEEYRTPKYAAISLLADVPVYTLALVGIFLILWSSGDIARGGAASPASSSNASEPDTGQDSALEAQRGALLQGKQRDVLLLLSPVLYYTALHVIFVGSIRYRVPVMPFALLFTAYSVTWLKSRVWVSAGKISEATDPSRAES